MTWLSYLSKMRALLRHPHRTRDEIVAFQNRQLRCLITHAYNNVPYYRRLFDHNGINLRDMRTVEDISAIPVTSKKDLQMLPVEELIAQGVDLEHTIVRKTTGSTGEPLSIRRTWFEERQLNAFRKRAMHYYGLRITDKHADIGEVEPLHPRDNQLLRRVFNVVSLYREVKIQALLPLDEIVRILQNVHPDVVSGYAGVLARVAKIMSDNDNLIMQPRFITTHSEVLTPLMRKQISEAFEARVFDTYDSTEFNLIAWECKETGELHTCDDSTIVEIIKDDGPAATGERGEVVVTNLHSFAMPLIRYRLGDIVTKGTASCPCGQPFSTIRAVQGRMFDYFLLPGGRMIHPFEITALLRSDNASWIRQYQLIQESEDRVHLKIVPAATPSSHQLSTVQATVANLLGHQVNFNVALVHEIPLEPSGKFRVCRSLVKSDYDGIDWTHA
jgi:phenylacetate-coenzyme A ligase PaaK-like adenylate-forming protein